jgi:hypothetical protein
MERPENTHVSQLRKRERAAIEAVARHFSATWGESEDGLGAHISIAGARIAVKVTALKQPPGVRRDAPKPGLRFDKVVRRVNARLQSALRESVPDGTTVLFTMTAPIRLAAKTAEALENTIRARLARRSVPVPYQGTIHGNRIRIRIARSRSRPISKVIGLVHNPDSDAAMLLHLMQSLLQLGRATADKRRPAYSAKQRWLVVIIERGFSHIETYRQVYAELSVPTDFTKILMVFAGGRVETLA